MNKKLVAELFKASDAYCESFLYLFNKYSEKSFEKQFSKWDNELYRSIRNALFQAITGETRTFDEFYDSFRAPASIGNKDLPIAWLDGGVDKYQTGDFGFIPDRMSDTLLDSKAERLLPVWKRTRRIMKLYNKALQIERKWLKRKESQGVNP